MDWSKTLLRYVYLLATFACVALTTLPTHAQRRNGGQKEDSAAQASAAEKKKKAREIDDAYKAALKAIPDKPKVDPWGSMRRP